jgi:hypothetical protein
LVITASHIYRTSGPTEFIGHLDFLSAKPTLFNNSAIDTGKQGQTIFCIAMANTTGLNILYKLLIFFSRPEYS